jgi:hypothetical protein
MQPFMRMNTGFNADAAGRRVYVEALFSKQEYFHENQRRVA